MENNLHYVKASLELHLFFARIMKEHAIFLEAGFTKRNEDFVKEASFFKSEFECLLNDATDLSQGMITPCVFNSGEIVTEYTLNAERKTQFYTCINIDENITMKQLRLGHDEQMCIDYNMILQVQQLNCRTIQLLERYILFKETIIDAVASCDMFTMNYPLLLEHILREAKFYYSYLVHYESREDMDVYNMQQLEQFWNQIMMEHALFISGLLDPSENELIQASHQFAEEYGRLLSESYEKNNMTIDQLTNETLQETQKFKNFKVAGTKGILGCDIQSIILPLLADHVLREANHYLRILEGK